VRPRDSGLGWACLVWPSVATQVPEPRLGKNRPRVHAVARENTVGRAATDKFRDATRHAGAPALYFTVGSSPSRFLGRISCKWTRRAAVPTKQDANKWYCATCPPVCQSTPPGHHYHPHPRAPLYWRISLGYPGFVMVGCGGIWWDTVGYGGI